MSLIAGCAVEAEPVDRNSEAEEFAGVELADNLMLSGEHQRSPESARLRQPVDTGSDFVVIGRQLALDNGDGPRAFRVTAVRENPDGSLDTLRDDVVDVGAMLTWAGQDAGIIASYGGIEPRREDSDAVLKIRVTALGAGDLELALTEESTFELVAGNDRATREVIVHGVVGGCGQTNFASLASHELVTDAGGRPTAYHFSTLQVGCPVLVNFATTDTAIDNLVLTYEMDDQSFATQEKIVLTHGWGTRNGLAVATLPAPGIAGAGLARLSAVLYDEHGDILGATELELPIKRGVRTEARLLSADTCRGIPSTISTEGEGDGEHLEVRAVLETGCHR